MLPLDSNANDIKITSSRVQDQSNVGFGIRTIKLYSCSCSQMCTIAQPNSISSTCTQFVQCDKNTEYG